MNEWNFEARADGTLKFAIVPQEIISIGDHVVIDDATGKLRRAVSGVDRNGFTVPLHAKIDLMERQLVIPEGIYRGTGKEMTMDQAKAKSVDSAIKRAGLTLRPVATDKGIEGFAEIAQQALSVDYGQAKGAIADATAALKRIVKRWDAAEDERFEIKATRGPTIEFTGKLLCEHEFEAGDRTRLKIYLAIYQTEGGALVAESSSLLAMGGGKEFIDTAVVPPTDDVQAMRFAVMDFFEWQLGARNMVTKQLKWSLRKEVT